MKRHGFLKEIAEDANTGYELASTTSRYRKLVFENVNAINFTEGNLWCSSEFLRLNII